MTGFCQHTAIGLAVLPIGWMFGAGGFGTVLYAVGTGWVVYHASPFRGMLKKNGSGKS
ncbi:hypothetical protein ACFQU1_08575 [Chelatococcus sp. GCM10030263]|uniref:hypothetical protein n=1 Tax=Chelatococcus sp. GCM10030263 TaxID=3273387 RepID=UPI00360A43B2